MRALRPDGAIFAVDHGSALSDEVVPMLGTALRHDDAIVSTPVRLSRENWALALHIAAVNARLQFIDDLRRAIAGGLLAHGRRRLTREPVRDLERGLWALRPTGTIQTSVDTSCRRHESTKEVPIAEQLHETD